MLHLLMISASVYDSFVLMSNQNLKTGPVSDPGDFSGIHKPGWCFFPGNVTISPLSVEIGLTALLVVVDREDPKKLLGMVRHNDVLSTHLYQDT